MMRLRRCSVVLSVILSCAAATLACGGDPTATTKQEGARSEPAGRPAIKKLGTIDCDLVETTPFVFHDRLYRFESVRKRYPRNELGVPYFRLVDVAAGKPLPPFGKSLELGCAFVHDDTVFTFGVKGWGTDTIYVSWSDDLQTWKSNPALKLPGWRVYNSSVCRAQGRYVMALEVGAPKEVVGAGFTNRFAVSQDLMEWKLLPEQHVFTKQHYSACPSIRFVDGFYYIVYLHSMGKSWESRIVRSRDLIEWEVSSLNPVMKFSQEDHRVAGDTLTAAECQRIANATNRNNSDVDFCEFNGKVVIYYSWGNQHGVEHLAEALYEGSLAELLQAYFPPAPAGR